MFLILKPDLSIAAVSDSYLRATKTKRDEILGKNMFVVFPDNPDDINASGVSNLRASLEFVLKNKTSHKMPTQKYDIRRPESEGGGFEEKFWEPSNTPVLDKNGEVLYIIHQAEDVTENLKAVTKADNLEHEKDLRENFVSMLSHDLKQPLSAIKMNAEMLLRNSSDPSKLNKRLVSLIDGVQRTERMINDLLDANRIHAGEILPLELQDCEMNTLVQETLRGLSIVYGDRFDFKTNLPINGRWNSDGVKRLLENLCSNAVKYGDKDARITVALKTVGEMVELCVHNYGPVLTKEEQDIIFTQYQRGTEGHTKGKAGWGLGLTLVRGITEAHGGTVTIESELQKGTTFKVILPLKPLG